MTGFAPWVILIVSTSGLIVALARREVEYLMIAMPIPIAGLAALLGKYPFADRLLLFAVPLLVVLLGRLLEAVPTRSIPIALVLILTYNPAKVIIASLAYPERFGREEFRDVFLEVKHSGSCPNSISLQGSANHFYRYYQHQGIDEGLPAGVTRADCRWMLFAHFKPEEVEKALAEAGMRRLTRISKPGAEAHLLVR